MIRTLIALLAAAFAFSALPAAAQSTTDKAGDAANRTEKKAESGAKKTKKKAKKSANKADKKAQQKKAETK